MDGRIWLGSIAVKRGSRSAGKDERVMKNAPVMFYSLAKTAWCLLNVELAIIASRHLNEGCYNHPLSYITYYFLAMYMDQFQQNDTVDTKTFQGQIAALQRFWGDQGCVLMQPLDMEVGAGTFHTASFLGAIGP